MKKDKIAILCIQESHSNDTLISNLNNKYNPSFHFIHSHDVENPRSKGIVIIKNNALIPNDFLDTEEITPGRALYTSIKWPLHTTIKLLVIYAPNSPRDNANFWETLSTRYDSPVTPRPDILLGDFNMVEEKSDRIPAHPDPPSVVNALHSLKNTIEVIDGWRYANPHPDLEFTFHQPAGGSSSRLDRIYVNESIFSRTLNWDVRDADAPTDHRMPSVQIYDLSAPSIGRGRWAIPSYLLDDTPTMLAIEQIGTEITSSPTNPQNDLQRFITQTYTLTRKNDKTIKGKMNSTIKKLENSIKKIQNKIDPQNPTTDQESIQLMTERIKEIKSIRYKRYQDIAKANWRLQGELINKYWCAKGKESRNRDTIMELRRINSSPPSYTTNSAEMAHEMAKHYENVQKVDTDTPENERRTVTNALLNGLPKINDTDSTTMGRPLEYAEIELALKNTPNDKAPGLNGVPAILYKKLHKSFTRNVTEDRESFDVINLLLSAYNDILSSGNADPKLLEGWLCPLYKKKDRREAANYRPITVLNAEYKILTSAIMNRFSIITPEIVHKNQAAFIKGRSIFDQIDLATRMIQLCELENQQGAIILLDQEKAYDRIRHDYLWQVLETANIPHKVIDLIKALYSNAYTSVILNGTLSSPFRVERGVRQGDPLSCILFNLAIEPMAHLLRNSNEIEGLSIKTPNGPKSVKTGLFADDTAVFLSIKNSVPSLFSLLHKWCLAAGAKFNEDKTVVIPLGDLPYRQKVLETRSLQPDAPATIKNSIKILNEGESTRYLGAEIGNNKNNDTPWPKTLEDIDKSLKTWEKAYPGIEGRKHITQMIIGGKTQFITAAQGMPEEYLNLLTKRIKTFIWGPSTPPVAMEYLSHPISHGGKNVLDLKARNEAITIMKLKKILDFSDNRTLAADATLAIINSSLRTSPPRKTNNRRPLNVFLHAPTLYAHGSASPIPKDIKNILKTGKKYNLTLDAPFFPTKLKLELPAWHHISETKGTIATTKTSKCLRSTHKIRTIADLSLLITHLADPDHDRRSTQCKCQNCPTLRNLGCKHPNKCLEEALKLVSLLPPKFNPLEPAQLPQTHSNDDYVATRNHAINDPENISIFPPGPAIPNNLFDQFRILGKNRKRCNTQASKTPQSISRTDTVVYTDGSCMNNGETSARAGIGVWFGTDDPRNIAAPVGKNIQQSNNTAELLAIYRALSSLPRTDRAHIKTDSKWAIRTICNHTESLDSNFAHTSHENIIRPILNLLWKRSGLTSFEWVKGHAGSEGNEGADTLAAEGASKDNTLNTIFIDSPELRTNGARLSSLTQATTYKLIRRQKMKNTPTRHKSQINLNLARAALRDLTDSCPTNERIWRAIARNRRDLSINVRSFLWKLLHNAHKCGPFWLKFQNFEDRGICTKCNTIESMNHILFECTENQCATIWKIAKEICEKKNIPWTENMDISTIMALPLIQIKMTTGRPRHGATRLFLIIASECAFLIWKLRCRRVIDPDNHPSISALEASNQVTMTLNRRIDQDRILTSRKRYGNKAIAENLVLSTWSGTLQNESSLPREWLTANGVLVGRTDSQDLLATANRQRPQRDVGVG